MNVPKITRIKAILEEIKQQGDLITDWVLPYENILTRLDAGIFFCNLKPGTDGTALWETLAQKTEGFEHKPNEDKKLSDMEHRITFKDVILENE